MYKRQIYYYSLLTLTILLGVFGILSVVQQIYFCTLESDNAFYNVAAIFFMAFHFIWLGLAIYAVIKSINQGSYIFNTLSYSPSGDKTVYPKIISGIFDVCLLAVSIYFTLFVCKVNVGIPAFPKCLGYSVINIGYFCVIYLTYFFIYPFLFAYKHTKGTRL